MKINILRIFTLSVFLITVLEAREIPFDKQVGSFDEIPVLENDRVTILLKDMKRISGNFIAHEMYTVTVRDDAGEVHTIGENNIAYCRIEYNRSRNALRSGMWGGIIGLFAGIPVGSHYVGQRSDDESVSDAFIYIGSSLGMGIVGGLIGTGIGLATTPGDVVYKIEQ